MNGFIGEIRLFGGNFAPRNWSFCSGQLLSIAQNTALFSILGTTYGGDGRTTFQLPDLRGRMAVSQGTGPGLPDYRLGQRGGAEQTFLAEINMPSHSHVVVSASVQAAAGDGTTGTADGNALAHAARGNTVPDIYNANVPSVGMAAGSAELTVGQAGGGTPYSNIQPVLACYYIICLLGTFPSRN